MSSNGARERLNELVAKAQEHLRKGEQQQAFEALKEASHLEAGNVQVQEALKALQNKEQTGRATESLRSYLHDGIEDSGTKALQALRQRQLPEHEAKQVLSLLLETNGPRPLLDALTGALLLKSSYARKEVAVKFAQPVTELFDQLYERGEESLKAFATIPLDASAWPSTQAQKAAQVDLFRLSVAKLIDVDIDHPERLMAVVARQLAVAPDNVIDAVDGDVFEAIASSLDIRLPVALRSQAMLACSKIFETTKERGESLFRQFIAGLVAKQTNDDLIIAFSAAAATFPMIPPVAAELFMTDGFVQQLVPNLERNSEAAAQGQR